jgi:hypothetical protein
MRASAAETAINALVARAPAIARRSKLRLLNSGVRANRAPHFPSFMVPLLFKVAGTAFATDARCA